MSGEQVSSKKGESLYKYKTGIIDANSNKGWPLTYGTDNPTGWQVQKTGNEALFPVTDYTKTAQWSQNLTSDPILSYGATSTDLGGINTTTNILGYIVGGVSAATGLLGLGMGVASLCKKDSSNSSPADASDPTLARLVESANNYDKKSDKTAMASTASSLTQQIRNVDKKLNTAKQNKTTAEKTLANLSTQKNDWETKLSDFDTAKSGLESEIIDIEGQISSLDPNSETYEADKKKLEALKAEKEQQLKDNYSDSKRKQITDQITRIEKEEDKWNVTLATANQDIEQLPEEKKKAEKALERLNKLINKN